MAAGNHAHRVLALEQRRRLVPSPRDLGGQKREDENARDPPSPGKCLRCGEDPRCCREREERKRKNQVTRLGRRVSAEAADREEQCRRDHDAGGQQAAPGPFEAEPEQAEGPEQEHGHEDAGVPGGGVAGDVPEVGQHVSRGAQRSASAADPDVEAARQHDAAAPERGRQDEDGREGRDRLAQAAPGQEHVQALRSEHQRSVRVRCDREQDRHGPESPGPTAAPVQRSEQGEVRDGREEQEEAVHPRVDPVEEEDPARRGDRRRRECGSASCEAISERGDRGHARSGEQGRQEAHRVQPAAGVGDRPGEEKVQWRPSPPAEDRVEQVSERLSTDEERQRLVLVRRPAGELDEQERPHQHGAGGDARKEETPVELPGSGTGGRRDARREGCFRHGAVTLRAVGGLGRRC